MFFKAMMLCIANKEAAMGYIVGLILFGVYAGGAWKFWTGFRRTNFTTGKAYLTLMWPVFLIANKSYRENFQKAIKGS